MKRAQAALIVFSLILWLFACGSDHETISQNNSDHEEIVAYCMQNNDVNISVSGIYENAIVLHQRERVLPIYSDSGPIASEIHFFPDGQVVLMELSQNGVMCAAETWQVDSSNYAALIDELYELDFFSIPQRFTCEIFSRSGYILHVHADSQCFSSDSDNKIAANTTVLLNGKYTEYRNQGYSIGTLNALINSFGGLSDYPDFSFEYPEFFSGVYINEYGAPVVVVKDDCPEIVSYVKSICGDDVVVILGRYSLNELLSTMNTLIDIFTEIEEHSGFQAMGTLDERNNSIKIYFFLQKMSFGDSVRHVLEIIEMIKDKVQEKGILIFEFRLVEEIGFVPD